MNSADAWPKYPQINNPLGSLQHHDADEAAIVSAQASTTIEPDFDTIIDDGYGAETNIPTLTSLSPTARNFAFENGRRYHKFREGRYVFPNDESEQDREDMKHAMIVNLCGGEAGFLLLLEQIRKI